MNELKPEDVMKALEQMASKANCNHMRYLEGCGYFCIRLGKNVDDMAKGRSPECNENCEHFAPPYIEQVLRSALALLREKDAEIEMLKQSLDYKCVYGYDGEVMEYCVQGPCPHYNMKKQVQAEAINEFAERLKACLLATGIYPVIVKNAIEKIKTSMKEEKI